MDSKKARIKEIVSSLQMFDDYINERTNILSMIHSKVLPEVESEDEQAAVLMQLGYLKKDLGFVRASAFGYLHIVHVQHPDVKYWIREVM